VGTTRGIVLLAVGVSRTVPIGKWFWGNRCGRFPEPHGHSTSIGSTTARSRRSYMGARPAGREGPWAGSTRIRRK
jgi:hypothetical protein